jgi:hypothetical protein
MCNIQPINGWVTEEHMNCMEPNRIVRTSRYRSSKGTVARHVKERWKGGLENKLIVYT